MLRSIDVLLCHCHVMQLIIENDYVMEATRQSRLHSQLHYITACVPSTLLTPPVALERDYNHTLCTEHALLLPRGLVLP